MSCVNRRVEHSDRLYSLSIFERTKGQDMKVRLPGYHISLMKMKGTDRADRYTPTRK